MLPLIKIKIGTTFSTKRIFSCKLRNRTIVNHRKTKTNYLFVEAIVLEWKKFDEQEVCMQYNIPILKLPFHWKWGSLVSGIIILLFNLYSRSSQHKEKKSTNSWNQNIKNINYMVKLLNKSQSFHISVIKKNIHASSTRLNIFFQKET